MKISYNWLKQFLNDLPPVSEVSSILTHIGLEVENLKKIQKTSEEFEGLSRGESSSIDSPLEEDYIFEIGLTANRGDAASHLGVARDLGAYLKKEVLLADVSSFSIDNERLIIPVQVEDEQNCKRYSSLTISNIFVKESPKWLAEKLILLGLRPINNIVDITNYILHDWGQPLHAFDSNTIRGSRVIVKRACSEDFLTTLDDKELRLATEDLIIYDIQQPICIAGVIGGKRSSVTASTKNIFLESAWFNPIAVRKTAKRHGLKTEASFRFERGIDPELTVNALKRAALLIKQVAGGEVSSPIFDYYPSPIIPIKIKMDYAKVARLIGVAIPSSEIITILTNLGFQIETENEHSITVVVPPYKVDIFREVDLIEEILRIYGYDKIEIPKKIKISTCPQPKFVKHEVEDLIGNLLVDNGFIEIISNSLTSSLYATAPEKAIKILNPLSSEFNMMRQHLLFGGLQTIAYNQNHQNPDLKMYEFGKVYESIGSSYVERQHLGIWITGDFQKNNWNNTSRKLDFYYLKGIVELVLKRLKLQNIVPELKFCKKNQSNKLAYITDKNTLVQLEKVSPSWLQKFDIHDDVFYADFYWDFILERIQNNKIKYQEISKFPLVRRDLSLLLDEAILFSHIKQIAQQIEKKFLKQINIFDVYQGDKIPKGKKSYALSFILQDEEKTLMDQQIDFIMKNLIKGFKVELGAEIRGEI